MSGFTPSEEQRQVIDAPDGSDVLVVAGAGSGKTFTMTRRIIALIERGVAPERILGLTFTRKAAGELLERVSAAVAAQRGGDARSSERTFLKPAVYTYDAFFQSIVRQYGLLVGFDQNTQPLSEAGAMQLVVTVLDEHMDELRGQDLGSFSELAKQVLALSNAIGSAMIGTPPSAAGSGTMGGVCDDYGTAIARVRAWDTAFAGRVRAILGDDPLPDKIGKLRFPRRAARDSDDRYAQKLAAFESQCHELCRVQCAGLLDATVRRETLLGLVEAYAAEKRRLNMAEFSDFTIAAYQLVERFPSIGRRYRRRFSHVLLDEYQDTSTTQANLIVRLFHGAQAGEGNTAVTAVGDPFQSIYAWRGASPGAFRMFQCDFGMPPEERPKALSVTRRNPRIVLEAANDLTLPLRRSERRAGSSLMREVDVPALSTLPGTEDGTLGVLGYATLGQEADAVARFCRHAVERHTSVDPATGEMRRGHAAVLFRVKNTIAVFQEALERAGLTTFTVGYSALVERPEVRDTLALLRVVSDHTDAGSLMRLLATPRFGMSAADLKALAGAAERANTEARFRALAEAGVVPADLPRDRWAQAVVEHRDQVANIVFLPDILLRGDLGLQAAADGNGPDGNRPDGNGPDRVAGKPPAAMAGLSAQGLAAVRRAGRVLRETQAAAGRPLADVVRAAVRALDLDVDLVVAQAMRDPSHTVRPTVARMPLDTLIDLVDAYVSELAAGRTPTLRGFMAWVDNLRDIEDEAAAMHDERADVELMTVHQAKGLEWDAVAIIGMADRVFPSSGKDSQLKVILDDRHPGGTEGGAWTAPEYHETAHTWLSDPTAVPAPVRVDAGILPRFPRGMAVDGDPIEALASLTDAETLDDEVFGSLRGLGEDAGDPDALPLTQEEEYGRRLHADERRLAYVALTRARHDALLTYSVHAEPSRDPGAVPEGINGRKPSPFWLEVHDALRARPDAVGRPSNLDAGTLARIADGCDDGTLPPLPQGFFAGDYAQDYEDAVVGQAWLDPIPPAADGTALPWPSGLSEETASRLKAGADAVRHALEADPGAAADVDGEAGQGSGPLPAEHSLLARARLLAADQDLMAGTLSGADLDRAIKAKARRILAQGRQSVTALQATAGGMDERQEREHWRGIVRPIPTAPSPAAADGTCFHAWAERFVNAWNPGVDANTAMAMAEDGASLSDGAYAGQAGPSREAMLEDLRRWETAVARPERRAAQSEHRGAGPDAGIPSADVLTWARRLSDSPWARRVPAWAERQIVIAVPDLGGAIVNGKLDAVFLGGLDPRDASKRYTVVDWKTGRRPRKPRDVQDKLVQLDLYRLLLATVEGVPLEAIDATLYYLSEPDERDRELHAGMKTEQEILAELRSGIPEQTDDD
ncbi:UvrD-helicase domain-containing protein [Bifidobacterium pullorum subsp. saeculare]|uniref:DNA 3'-5' helicase n=1 Tax=Bifidobacterium pullorum subsp. saeculare TaxID=78257 RepID=A0A939B9W7_9BIFI|nr:ATP-dependent DNA helicase [Bifidobacterium pullorum]MBM6699680.1 UvrD-helicase domain-containing protein [Bifidobacterium pullorum subsp. saeculare]